MNATDKITVVRGTVPDVDKGGRLVDGVLIGPRLSTCRWQIGSDAELFDDRSEAEKELKRREFNQAIFDAVKADLVGVCSTRDFVNIIRNNSRKLRKILTNKHFDCFTK